MAAPRGAGVSAGEAVVMEPAERPPAALIAAGGVFLPGHLAEPVWRVLRDDIRRRQRDGGRVRPEVARALEVLRAAAMAYLSASGHDLRTSADVAAESNPSPVITTAELADLLGVSSRHARRIARSEGVAPVARNVWAREDAAALVKRRSYP